MLALSSLLFFFSYLARILILGTVSLIHSMFFFVFKHPWEYIYTDMLIIASQVLLKPGALTMKVKHKFPNRNFYVSVHQINSFLHSIFLFYTVEYMTTRLQSFPLIPLGQISSERWRKFPEAILILGQSVNNSSLCAYQCGSCFTSISKL